MVLPDSAADIPSVPIENLMHDLWVRGALPTEANRVLVENALRSRRLAYCGLCTAPAAGLGLYAPHQPLEASSMRAIFYGYCTACQSQPDFDARIAAEISAAGSIGHVVELAASSSPVFRPIERAEWIKQFPESVRELLWDRVAHPELYGLDICNCCRSQPMAVFSFYPEFHATDGTRHMFLYSLCLPCHLTDGHDRMEAKAQSRGLPRRLKGGSR